MPREVWWRLATDVDDKADVGVGGLWAASRLCEIVRKVHRRSTSKQFWPNRVPVRCSFQKREHAIHHTTYHELLRGVYIVVLPKHLAA